MMWIVIGIVVCFLGMMPFAQQLYTFVAEPLMANLPKDTSMIATDVIAPFFVPVKVTLMAAFLLSLPHTLYQVWAFVAPALYQNEKAFDYAAGVVQRNAFLRRYGVCLFSGVSRYFQILGRCNPCRRQYGDRYRQISVLYFGHVCRIRYDV